jgi:hypothetical protein
VKNAYNILEIPVDESRNVNDLVKWFEQKKIHEKDHPLLSLSVKEEHSKIGVLGIVLVVVMALIALEEKGKLKAKRSPSGKSSPDDFLHLITKSETESKMEELLEARYNLDLILHIPHHGSSYASEPKVSYNLNDVFGIWKDQKVDLNTVRKEQWGKRK